VGVGTAAPVSTFEVCASGFPGTVLTRTAAFDNYGVGIQYSLISSTGSFRGYYARAFGGSFGTIATTNQNQANGYFGIDVANAGLFASDTVGISGVQFYVAPTISVFNTRVGIGTTNPGSNFTVSGGGSFGSGYNAFTAPTGGLIVQGNVGIGTTNPGLNALQVTGNVVTSGFTSNATNTVFNFDTMTVPFVNATQVGVGVTIPQSPLHVNAAVGGNGLTIGPDTPYVTSGSMFGLAIINSTLTSGQSSVIQIGKSVADTMFISYNYTGASASSYLAFAGYGYSTQGSLCIRNDGKVGIGTSNPNAPLEVQNQTSATTVENLWLTAPNLTAGQQSRFFWGKNTSSYNGGFFYYYHVGDGSTSNYFRLDFNGKNNVLCAAGTGNVGIGTSNPAYSLDIGQFAASTYTLRLAAASTASGTMGTSIRMMEANDTYGFSFQNLSGSRFGIFRHSASSAGSEIISILRDNPYVGIGITNPTKPLVVLRPGAGGNNPAIMVANNGSGSGFRISTYDMTADGQAYMGLGTDMGGNAYEHSLVFPYGSVGQGIQTVGWYNGSTYSTRAYIQTGSTNWVSVSDIRAKDIVRPISNVLPLLSNLSTIVYTLKDDIIKTNHLGLIAQEVALVFPEACDIPTDPEQRMGITYTELVPVLVEAVKELTAKNADLEARLAALEGTIGSRVGA
jgi:hypothetical protein